MAKKAIKTEEELLPYLDSAKQKLLEASQKKASLIKEDDYGVSSKQKVLTKTIVTQALMYIFLIIFALLGIWLFA